MSLVTDIRMDLLVRHYDRQTGYVTDIGTGWSWSWYDGQMIDVTNILMDLS